MSQHVGSGTRLKSCKVVGNFFAPRYSVVRYKGAGGRVGVATGTVDGQVKDRGIYVGKTHKVSLH